MDDIRQNKHLLPIFLTCMLQQIQLEVQLQHQFRSTMKAHAYAFEKSSLQTTTIYDSSVVVGKC